MVQEFNPLDPLGIFKNIKRDINRLLPGGAKSAGFTKGQTIVIKSKAIYGWKAWVTVERDDPEHNQVWVQEITPAVKYEDIEED